MTYVTFSQVCDNIRRSLHGDHLERIPENNKDSENKKVVAKREFNNFTIMKFLVWETFPASNEVLLKILEYF